MSATALYRIAAVLLVLFAIGHTFGFLHFKPPTPRAAAVRQEMSDVRFPVRGGSASFGDFYVGFGLSITAYLLFAAFLTWHLGGLARSIPRAIGALGWAFCALQVASTAVSWVLIAPPPAVLFAVLAVCTGWAAGQVRVATARSESPR